MNANQLERYKSLVDFIDVHFKEEIDIERVEQVCHYSYRNINRIFIALHQETIGKYIKRLRLEKAAQYLKFTNSSVSDIAFEVGFEDIAAFSKAFKKKYDSTPTSFRNSKKSIPATVQPNAIALRAKRRTLDFEIEYLPDFEFLCLEYRGPYDDIGAIEKTWEQLIIYGEQKKMLDANMILMAEIMDDDEITENVHCRYSVSLVWNKPITFEPDGLFKVKQHKRQKYAKFIHKGSHESSVDTYNHIYANWMLDVGLEFEDLPNLEFFLNDDGDTPPDELLTEIYIPIK